MMLTIVVVAVFVFLALLVYWVCKFFELMNMDDGEFVGRYDKVLWFIVVVFGFVLGAILFAIWKRFGAAERRLEREMAQTVDLARRGKDQDTSEPPP